MDLDLSEVTDKEVPRLARILKAVADEEVHIALPPGAAVSTVEAMLRASTARAERGLGVELGARVKGRLVGGGSLEPGGPRQTHVGDIYLFLAPDWRGKGIGGRLLDALEAAAPDLGIRKLTATVLAGNANARQLFESRRYETEGVRRRHRDMGLFEEDEVLFARFL